MPKGLAGQSRDQRKPDRGVALLDKLTFSGQARDPTGALARLRRAGRLTAAIRFVAARVLPRSAFPKVDRSLTTSGHVLTISGDSQSWSAVTVRYPGSS